MLPLNVSPRRKSTTSPLFSGSSDSFDSVLNGFFSVSPSFESSPFAAK